MSDNAELENNATDDNYNSGDFIFQRTYTY